MISGAALHPKRITHQTLATSETSQRALNCQEKCPRVGIAVDLLWLARAMFCSSAAKNTRNTTVAPVTILQAGGGGDRHRC